MCDFSANSSLTKIEESESSLVFACKEKKFRELLFFHTSVYYYTCVINIWKVYRGTRCALLAIDM